MRLFQNAGLYPAYRPHYLRAVSGQTHFRGAISSFLQDRYEALHILKPVHAGSPEAFFTLGDDEFTQRLWARENGLPAKATLLDILLAQIEEHRTEVFYNLDPIRHGEQLVQRLPSCVKRSIAWQAAPAPKINFGVYDLVVCNFPSLLDGYRALDWKADYFFPAFDPEMEPYAANLDRPIDVLFVGTYSRHHKRRAEMLEHFVQNLGLAVVQLNLNASKATRLAEALPAWTPYVEKYRRPEVIRTVAKAPVVGRGLYEVLSKAKIVLNGAVDMAQGSRGNLRCFETMGCGAALLSDLGDYPEGMDAGKTFAGYDSAENAVRQARAMLGEESYRQTLAKEGHEMIKTRYSKSHQWDRFQILTS